SIFGHLLAINRESAKTTFAEAATVVFEVKINSVLARREFLGANNASLVWPLFRILRPVLICVRVCEHRLSIQDEQTPAAEASTLGRQHTVGPAFRDLNIGSDAERLVVHVGGVSFRNTNHAGVVCEVRLTAQKIWTG